ncbi:hypothetical protein BDW_08610 [Bdellovibrio bacteriovorus W]|nr:hypothetical protein BDW_08610 [Bdellovibrio bacteriovorus W]
MEQIRDLLESAIKKIVPYPDEVQISYEQGAKTVVYKVDCTQRNFAFLLGSKGRTIDALRVLANVMTSKAYGMRAIIEVPFFRPDKYEAKVSTPTERENIEE